MRYLVLAPLWLAACSVDWSLARQSLPDAHVDPGDDAESPLARAERLCDVVPVLPSAPAIDGRLEPDLALYSWLDGDVGTAPGRLGASVSVAHRPDGLYFFVGVTDPTRDPVPDDGPAYCGDGVELFVDDDGAIGSAPAYDTPGTMQFVVAAPSAGASALRRAERYLYPGAGDAIDLGDWTSTRFVAVPTETGYTVEAMIVAPDLGLAQWPLAPGGKIGWNLSLNVGGPADAGTDVCTTRQQQVHFRLAASGTCTAPYCNASALCATTLAEP